MSAAGDAQIRRELLTDHELVLLGQWAADRLYEGELSLDEAKALVAKLVTIEDWRRP